MAKLLKLRRGSTSGHNSFTGAEGEVTVDITKDTAVVHDGSTAGGRPLAREDMNNVSSASIVGRIGTSALAGTKISPDFGSQNIATTGTVSSGDVTITDGNPSLSLIDSGDNPDFKIHNQNGQLRFSDETAGVTRLIIQSDGTLDVQGNLDANSGLDVSGAITSTGSLTITNTAPQINFVDTNADDDFEIKVNAGNFAINDATNSANRFLIDSSGTVDINGNLDVGAGIDVTGDSNLDGKLTITQDGSTTPEIEFDGTGPNFIRFNDDAGGTNGMDLVFRSSPNTIGFETSDNASSKFTVSYTGQATFAGNVDVGAGVDVTGNITVTGTVDGRDVASDGSKLDGIESGATADQTASEIVALVADQTIAPSEIDMEDSEKIKLGTGDDLQLYHNGTKSFVENSTGDLILKTANSIFLEPVNGESGVTVNANGSVELYHDNSKKLETASGGVNVTGALVASGNVTAFSDSRLKTEIHTIKNPLDKVERLRGVTFKWLHTDKPSSGVIAQEVQEVFPELVESTTHEGKEVLSVDYGKLVGVLIESIKELKAEFEAHKAECAKQHGGE